MTPKTDFERRRNDMVDRQISARGVSSPAVLEAMRRVRRERYVPANLSEFAYDDAPLPIEEGQTISQPYIVALMTEALGLSGSERVLEIGTGSGYAAAVLAEIAAEVYTIERIERLARLAERRLRRDGYSNVHVRHGDGTLGWPEAAPFDAIVVAAGGPEVPHSLREQLAIGGRLVIPVGEAAGLQKLVRVTRTGAGAYEEEELADVRFVPLIGEEGWKEEPRAHRASNPSSLAASLAAAAEPFGAIDDAPLAGLLERIGDARLVLLGEATHGSSEFHAMRARITQELVVRKGFGLVAVEADWPDAARIDHYVRDIDAPRARWRPFARFPTWLWRNTDVERFVEWLREHNDALAPARRVRFAGLDLYSLSTSIGAILDYLDAVDPDAGRLAQERYGCLTPWQSDPTSYGRAAVTSGYRSCELEVVQMLEDLLAKRLEHARESPDRFFDAVQNARLVAGAEQYYRSIYYGAHESWNFRDRHMFETIASLLDYLGPGSKAVIWAHNSHVGDARATAMAARGTLNIGQLCRERWADAVYIIGFGTDSGTVAAASRWDGPMEVQRVRPAHPASYESLCHEAERDAFLLPLRSAGGSLRELLRPRLERAIGVIYRPETELESHYFQAVLPGQFDEYVWFDRTRAVTPLDVEVHAGTPETYPFGL